MNQLGRKRSLIILTLISMIGFSLTAAGNLIVICCGRVICGISVGASVSVGNYDKLIIIDYQLIIMT